MADTPLEAVPGWSPEHLERMRKAWITTADQVVALSATENGVRSLSEQLQVPVDEAQHLVELARSRLSATTRTEMEQKVDTSNYGLGVPPLKREKDR